MINQKLTEDSLKAWIGNTQCSEDTIEFGQVKKMLATLDEKLILKTGYPLPALWHWLYFLESSANSKLGNDGHTNLGEFLPPIPLPCRMWAGGRFSFLEPIKIGEILKKLSTVKDIKIKHGKNGPLCFITVLHELIDRNGQLRLSEEHDIVYREKPVGLRQISKPLIFPEEAEWTKIITPTPVMLFRYSALTFNSHRIHYDRKYCQEVEGYENLIFHGPLTATLLVSLAVKKRPNRALSNFNFRSTAPLFDNSPFKIHGKQNATDENKITLWAEGPSKGLAMEASATFY